jgi:hypothetical protein
MCKSWKTGTCSNLSCTYAHEDDGFARVIPFTTLRQEIDGGLAPSELLRLGQCKGKKPAEKDAMDVDQDMDR